MNVPVFAAYDPSVSELSPSLPLKLWSAMRDGLLFVLLGTIYLVGSAVISLLDVWKPLRLK
jgi:hypothetical protein